MKHSVDKIPDAEPFHQDASCQQPLAPDGLISGNLVRQELERVLSSRTFQAAEGQKKFLRYAVEHTIAGCAHEVKEYTVGVQVFNRGQSFDQRLDPIVRVEARKLRSRLAKYYESEGEHDPVRIELPSRGYVPTFREANFAKASPQTTSQSTMHAGGGADREPAQSSSANVTLSVHPEPSLDTPGRAVPAISQANFVWRWRNVGLLGAVLMLTGVAIYGGRLVLSSRAASPVTPSIAVLPFQNLGDSKDQSFADGLTDELIDSLGTVQGLQVVARTSAFQFRSKTLDIREIGKALNVRTVLEGSVRIYGNRLRITTQLDDTSNGYRVWSNSYEHSFEDALFVQRDISQAIVAALREEFAKIGAPRDLKFSPGKAVLVKAEAYQDYLRGLYFWNKQTADSIKTAMGYFEQAISEDPGYALPYTGLARCYVNIPAFTQTRARDVLPKIRELALKALELDSSLAEPHIDLAFASFLEYNWAGAEAEFKKGLQLSPGDAVAHRWYAMYLANVGRLDDALAENEISQQLDPVSPYMLEGTARSLYRMRRYDEAIEQFKKALALDPQFGYAHLGLGTAYIQKHIYPEAIAELQLARQQMGNSPSPIAELARAYAASGNTSEARKILRELLDQSGQGSFPPKPIADVYLALGDKGPALEWLAKAISARDMNLGLKSDPIYDPVRSDPRFTQLLRDAKLATSLGLSSVSLTR
jgi:TolB-like protein/Flp pilus assembly protein TadD